MEGGDYLPSEMRSWGQQGLNPISQIASVSKEVCPRRTLSLICRQEAMVMPYLGGNVNLKDTNDSINYLLFHASDLFWVNKRYSYLIRRVNHCQTRTLIDKRISIFTHTHYMLILNKIQNIPRHYEFFFYGASHGPLGHYSFEILYPCNKDGLISLHIQISSLWGTTHF